MFGNLGNLSAVPYVDQYFGIWAMAEARLIQTWQAICQLNIAQHLVEAKARQSAGEKQNGLYRSYTTGNGIAVVELSGMLMKQESSLGDNTSTVAARKTIRALANDPMINGVMLMIDSPGGTAAGTSDLADEIAALSKKKPTIAYCDGLTASAAYWVASQATLICAGKDAIVGSIGTYAVVADMSVAAKEEGITVHVIRAGEFKGAGTPGTEITPEQLTEMQRMVDALNQHFVSVVASGRKMSAEQMKQVADGRVHIGADAQKLGLIDFVENFDSAVARLESMITKQKTAGLSGSHSTPKAADSGPQKGSTMSQDTQGSAPSQAGGTSKAATISELKAAFPNDAAHALNCAEKGMTLVEAQAAYSTVLAAQNASLQQQLAEANKPKQSESDAPGSESDAPGSKSDAPGSKSKGVAPISNGGKSTQSLVEGDPVVAFNDAVVAQMKVPGYEGRQSAIVAVCRNNPALHQAYLLATNPVKVHSKINDHFAN